jgi:hypothetical protein
MKDSCIVWVGSAQGSFSNLDVAMKTHMDDVPVCSTLIGEGGDGIGASLSKRLALKLGRQVYICIHPHAYLQGNVHEDVYIWSPDECPSVGMGWSSPLVQVYVSYNLPGNQQLLQAAVEKKMVEELSRIMPKAAASWAAPNPEGHRPERLREGREGLVCVRAGEQKGGGQEWQKAKRNCELTFLLRPSRLCWVTTIAGG